MAGGGPTAPLPLLPPPADLGLIKQRVLGNVAGQAPYLSRDQFAADVALMLSNCRRYNRPDTEFVACANKLEPYFKARVRALALAQAQALAVQQQQQQQQPLQGAAAMGDAGPAPAPASAAGGGGA